MTAVSPTPEEAAALGRLALGAKRDSRQPWRLIWNEIPAKRFSDGKPAGTCPDVHSLRIVDADQRLLVRIEADPEQVLRGEDMAFIAACSPDVVLSLLAALRDARRALEEDHEQYVEINNELFARIRVLERERDQARDALAELEKLGALVHVTPEARARARAALGGAAGDADAA